MTILEICQKQPCDILAVTPRGATVGLCFACIVQAITHPALPFILQSYHKPLAILQRVTKSQKVHISSHDRL